MKKLTTLLCLLFTIITNGQVPTSDPLFPNSIVSTDFDFIKANDPDAFTNLNYVGRENKEMPGSQSGNLFDTNTFIFEATFSNGKKVGIWCHSSFNNRSAAEEYANKVSPRLGKLPEFMRDVLSHVVIHNGDGGAFAESEGNFFVLYSDNMDTRISNNDLEETVFHESVHASLDATHLNTSGWRQAQIDDGNFITEYAESRSNKEDLAETAIFAYTMVKYPGRLSSTTEDWANTHIPNRLNYIINTVFDGQILGINSFIPNKPINSLVAYPNPTTNTINVLIEKVTQKNSELTIYDISGKLIKTLQAKQGENKINIKQLPRGAYFITTTGYQAKVIKQ